MNNGLFIIDQWSQIGNKTLDLSQIFAAPFLRPEPSIANHHRDISNAVQLFAGQFLGRRVALERVCRYGKVTFQPLRINPRGRAQFAAQLS